LIELFVNSKITIVQVGDGEIVLMLTDRHALISVGGTEIRVGTAFHSAALDNLCTEKRKNRTREYIGIISTATRSIAILKHHILLISQVPKPHLRIIRDFRVFKGQRSLFLVAPTVMDPSCIVSK